MLEKDLEQGELVNLIHANTSTIKKERGNQVLTNVHITFKQKIDAVWNKINEYKIRQTDLLHKLVPKTTIETSFDVNSIDFVDKNLDILKEMANEELWLEKLKIEYKRLFGKDYVEPESFL